MRAGGEAEEGDVVDVDEVRDHLALFDVELGQFLEGIAAREEDTDPGVLLHPDGALWVRADENSFVLAAARDLDDRDVVRGFVRYEGVKEEQNGP